MAKRISAYLHLLMAAAVLSAATAYGAEMCRLDELTEAAADDPRCYFYSGTSAYRANDFKFAAANWKRLIALKLVAIEFEHLKVDAYNNLGYLYFFGNGVKRNREVAIKYWKYSLSAGNEESAYHLCHAYGDRKEPTYNSKLALGYCKEGLRRYEALKDINVGQDEILRQLNAYVRELE